MENKLHSTKKDDLNGKVNIAIIGAGIAGLSAAVFARKAGYSVRVFEQHAIPGGLCTAWKRKGYLFDYCIDWFMGANKTQGFYGLWKELGLIDKVDFLKIESFGSFTDANGRELTLYTDYRQLMDHLLTLAPEDKKMIRSLCRSISHIKRMLLTRLNVTPKEFFKALVSMPTLLELAKWSKISAADWAAKAKSPLLREGIPGIVGADIPMAGPIMVLGLMANGGIGFPVGGSLPLAVAVWRYAKSLGAEFSFKTPVKQIVVRDGKATALELENGTVQEADCIIAASDIKTVMEKLVQPPLRHPDYEELFLEKPLNRKILQISFGVKKNPLWNLENRSSSLSLPLDKPVTLEGQEIRRLTVRNYAKDSSLSPEGGVVLIVRFEGSYSYWEDLYKNKELYKQTKEQIAAQVLESLEPHFPGIGQAVVSWDVATPITCIRYTGNWEGSSQGWIMNSKLMRRQIKGQNLPKTLPEAKGLYFAGQWTMPGGGLPPSAQSGKDVIQLIQKGR